jgi:metal-responsive CopG/Arc/MetJ family transcriptional regulator
MRTHISLPKELVDEIDHIAGPRHRSEFIEDAVRLKLLNERQKRALELALLQPLSPAGHVAGTAENSSKWVHDMRQAEQAYTDARRELLQRERERRLKSQSP